ncbi:hypothetical protein BGX26_001239 [Mortierella sp. AD094]|nr:hypothetical protein BGX26_001239 [Mortierella sp. AD094]
MHQLSRLKKLKVLSIKCLDSHNGDENLSFGRLDLRLIHGSDVLASLKRLEAINFYGLLQQLDVQDVEWMLQEWPNLKHVVGKPNTAVAVYVSPWEIPEVRAHLAQFLGKPQIKAAAAVCKSWSATFTPFLYSSLSWHTGLDTPVRRAFLKSSTMQAVQKHASSIRSVVAGCDAREFCLGFPCDAVTQLQEFVSHGDVESASTLDRIIQQNPRLRKIEFNMSDTTNARALIKSLSNCPDLGALNIDLHRSDLQMTTHLLDICTQLRELKIFAAEVNAPDSLDSWPQFPFLTRLSFSHSVSSTLILEIVRRCPQLRKFHWSTFDGQIQISDLIQVISTGCRELTEVELISDAVSGGELAQVVNSCSKVTALGFRIQGPELLAIQALRQRFSSLT